MRDTPFSGLASAKPVRELHVKLNIVKVTYKKERRLYRPVNNGNKTNIGFILYKNKQPVVRANKNLISHIY